MMDGVTGHLRWAMDLSRLLNLACHADRFPVNVEQLALEFSANRFPKDPIKAIKGGDLKNFEGALYPIGDATGGWAVIYNEVGISPGRRRFTVAHEFGHYLAHRHRLPDGIACDASAIDRREGLGIEKEADEFAAYLLMPFDDFRSRIAPSDKPDIEALIACAKRYGVSLTAAVLRWLEYTERRAVMVVSRDGGALWAKSSQRAFQSGRFLRTKAESYFLPESSPAATGTFDTAGRANVIHEPGVWFPEETEEMSVRSERFDLTITVLHLPKETPFVRYDRAS